MSTRTADCERVSRWFQSDANELSAFDLIPEADRPHPDRTISGMIKLASLMGEPDRFWLCLSADHDQIRMVGLDCLVNGLTRKDVTYLVRCGIMFDSDGERFVIIC